MKKIFKVMFVLSLFVVLFTNTSSDTNAQQPPEQEINPERDCVWDLHWVYCCRWNGERCAWINQTGGWACSPTFCNQ
jgi:hypothetical protein